MAGITVDFNANLAQLQSGINQANAQLARFGTDTSRVAGQVQQAFTLLISAIAGREIVEFTKSIVDAADGLRDLSIRTDISVENLAGLRLVADQSGSSLQGAADAILKLSRNIGDTPEEFAKLGITAKDPLIAFEQLADVFNSIDDPQTRAAVGAKTLGRAWADVAPLLSLGREELSKQITAAAESSKQTKQLADDSDELNDKLAELAHDLRGGATTAISALPAILTDVIDYFNKSEFAVANLTNSSGLMTETFKTLAESLAVTVFGVEILGKSLGALGAKTADFLSGNFTNNFHVIDDAFKEDVKAASIRLDNFFDLVENGRKNQSQNPLLQDAGSTAKIAQKADIASEKTDVASGSTGKNAGFLKSVKDFVGASDAENKKINESLRAAQTDLQRHLSILGNQIEDEVNQYSYRNKKIQVALDVGLLSEADFYRQKSQLEKDQLAETKSIIDQQINALRQYQSQIPTSDQNAQIETQDKINDLVRKKTELERQSQIATLENAAAARNALGEYAGQLTSLNDLLQGITNLNSSIIGIAPQVDPNIQSGGSVTPDALANKNIIFSNEAGNSFSDRPASVGITLDVSQEQQAKVKSQVDDLISQIRDQAVKDSAVLLGVNVDQAGAIAKINEASSAINKSLSEIKPAMLKIDVDQAMIINAVSAARDAAQAAVKPVVVPVVYQAQNSPSNAAASAGNVAQNLSDAALAAGGR